MENASRVLRFVADNKTSLGYGLMALLTVGGEAVFSAVSFQCPCSAAQNLAYGLSFLLGPAGVLLLVALLRSSTLWRLYTGCCRRPARLCPGGSCGCLPVLLGAVGRACVAPLMWLSVALLNGTFYECAASGVSDPWMLEMICGNRTRNCPAELARVPCAGAKVGERAELLLMLRAQSQILGWSLILIGALLGLLATCWRNCRSEVSYLQRTFWSRYTQKERESFDKLCEDYAGRLADRNLRCFFERREADDITLPKPQDWEEVSGYYNFSRREQSYSILQNYVENKSERFSESSPMDPEGEAKRRSEASDRSVV